ncbi:MAG: alpha/beta hydrolase [Alphaproteobacteria bacterium]|nr:alpha/beta hydrolase [Alphaproteobacteria bacterium]
MDLTVLGKRAHAATGGKAFDPARPAVVFIHGAGSDHTAWSLQTRYFAHRGRGVIAVDLPGHGKSEGPALPTIGAMADWLNAFLDAAGATDRALVGHSMGSLVALEAAARRPERVGKLALLGTTWPMAVTKDLLDPAKADDPLAGELITSWSHSRTGHFGGAEIPGLWLMGGSLALLARAAPGVIHNDLAACNAYQEAPAAAAKIKAPTLFLLGERDLMTHPRKAREFAALFAGAKIVVLPGAGHMFMAEAPGPTLDALKAFL